MKKLLAAILLVTCIAGTANAANIILEKNEQNCKKINSWTVDSREAIASNLGVSIQSISFIRSRYQYGCFVIADTPKGPHRCYVEFILSDDKGKTAFANIVMYGNAICDPN